jgi:hypothetical protein
MQFCSFIEATILRLLPVADLRAFARHFIASNRSENRAAADSP